eukprot:TRINITY_DN3977_c0_g1_i1.p1 TRINITY_DN3977_c0_g1~~TRINITY_DN3977_c0_g1_i1.p1  ORF type:complete len:352 (+),score=49.73 TRINITY_DN3977_c0_g1_i1:76-1131(+)
MVVEICPSKPSHVKSYLVAYLVISCASVDIRSAHAASVDSQTVSDFAFIQKKVAINSSSSDEQPTLPYCREWRCYEARLNDAGTKMECLRRKCSDGFVWTDLNSDPCCVPTCAAKACPKGHTNAGIGVIVRSQAYINLCCKCQKCSLYDCPAVGFQKKTNAENICGDDDETCCNPSCDQFTCPASYRNVANAAKVFGSDAQTCCEGIPCEETTCPAGSSKKGASENVAFDGRVYPCCNPPSLAPETNLAAGSSLTVPSGRLVLQDDGNLVMYDAKWKPLWNSGTANSGATLLRFQGDCNVVLYSNDNQAKWARCDTSRNGCASDCTGATLELQYDMKLALKRNGEVLWSVP